MFTEIIQEFKDSTYFHKTVVAVFVALTRHLCVVLFVVIQVTGNALMSELTCTGFHEVWGNSVEKKERSFKGWSEGRLACLACQSSFPFEKLTD